MEQQASDESRAATSKKIRMTLACERCRSKKVKCDFTHPTCSRCKHAKATCSYNGTGTQVDLFNLVKLNETVAQLQKQVQSIESGMRDAAAKDQQKAAGGSPRHRGETSVGAAVDVTAERSLAKSAPSDGIVATMSDTHWSLSLTPNGLRVDTDIVSLRHLYEVLLSGISRSNVDDHGGRDGHNHGLFSCSSSLGSSACGVSLERTVLPRKKALWKMQFKTFPIYNRWEPTATEAKQRPDSTPEPLSKQVLDQLMDIYAECMLCLPCPENGKRAVDRYKDGMLDPLLLNTMIAWTARHAAIHHNFFPGKDPNAVGEAYFEMAKELLKERFSSTNVDTMHSLIILYMYAIGRPGSSSRDNESEAYIYLGLAIRMCLDLKMHLESTSPDPVVQERNRRYFWTLYFLETLCSVQADRPYFLPSDNVITVGLPTVMDHETGERRWRIEFIRYRYQLARICHRIARTTAEEKLHFATVTELDRELQTWYDELPDYYKYAPDDVHARRWDTMSFREQACVKLNAEYQSQLCQLYGVFASKSLEHEEPSAVGLLARKACLKASDIIIDLLRCWSKLRQPWCHFTAEILMVPIAVYGDFYDSSPKDTEWTRRQLNTIVDIMTASPVRHQKHVVAVVAKVNGMLAQLDGGTRSDTEPTNDTDTQPEASLSPTQCDLLADQSVETPAQTSNTPGPMCLLDEPMLDTDAAFGLIKHEPSVTMDTMHFSDFLYSPTAIDYGTRRRDTELPSQALDTTHDDTYAIDAIHDAIPVNFPHMFSSPSSTPSYSGTHSWSDTDGLNLSTSTVQTPLYGIPSLHNNKYTIIGTHPYMTIMEHTEPQSSQDEATSHADRAYSYHG